MSKKSRRERRPNLPPEAFNVPERAPEQPKPAATAESPQAETVARVRSATAPAAPAAPDLKRAYGEVLDDLRLTAIIFAALITVMVVLSFIIR